MSELRNDRDDLLRRRLRAGDPGAGSEGLDRGRATAMRRRILAETGTRRAVPVLSWLAGALAVLALGFALAPLWWQRVLPSGGAIPVGTTASAALDAPVGRESREIQYTTPRGTLVVWVLDPNFNLSGGE